MKIEKLTENKIRVVIHTSELSTDDADINEYIAELNRYFTKG